MIRFKGGQAPVTEERLLQFEAKIGATLPLDYRTFLLEQNGGRPDVAAFRFGTNVYQDSCVDYFYALYSGESLRLDSAYDNFREWQRTPPDLIPIACDPGSSQICLGIAGSNRGKVLFWDYEHEPEAEEGEPRNYENVFHVANSFTEFLRQLSLK